MVLISTGIGWALAAGVVNPAAANTASYASSHVVSSDRGHSGDDGGNSGKDYGKSGDSGKSYGTPGDDAVESVGAVVMSHPLPVSAAAGEASTDGEVVSGGLSAMAGFFTVAAVFVLRRHYRDS